MFLFPSAFVGLAAIVALLPLPGFVTKLVQKTQKEQLKKKAIEEQMARGENKAMEEKAQESQSAQLPQQPVSTSNNT